MPSLPVTDRSLRALTLGMLAALIGLIVVWELAYAPAGVLPRPFWLLLKLAPLLAALVGVWRGRRTAVVVAGLIVLLYFTESLVLGFGALKGLEAPATLGYAAMELLLTSAGFAATLLYARRLAGA